MNLRTIILSTFVLVLATQSLRANGDPVVRFSSVNRVAVPEPLDISEIQIVGETVKISHVDGYNCFDVTYQLVNNSDRDFPELHYGFPIDYLVADEQEIYHCIPSYISESSYEVGWNEKLIKDVSFRLDNKELPFAVSKESVREAGLDVYCNEDSTACDSIPIDGINRRWFYTELSIASRAEAVLNVKYKVYANTSQSAYGRNYQYYCRTQDDPSWAYYMDKAFSDRYFSHVFTITYDFTPARHFGNGRSYNIDVEFDFSAVKNPWIYENGYRIYTSRLTCTYYKKPVEIKPIYLRVYHDADLSEEFCKMLIDKFAVSRSDYSVHSGGNEVRVDFRTPRFVSEITCDMDTAAVKSFDASVTYSDGHTVCYKYSQKKRAEENSITNPIFLIITDMVTDGFKYEPVPGTEESRVIIFSDKSDSDMFKVTNITFTFPEGVSARSAMKNVRPLDSRF